MYKKGEICINELDIISTVLNYKIPIRIKERLKDDWNMKLGNNNALRRECSLMYCDNDICYYYCTDDYYVYMNTKAAMKLMDESIEKDAFGGVFIDSLFKNDVSMDHSGMMIKYISEKYCKYSSIRMNSFVDSYFKSTLISKVNNNVDHEPFRYLDGVYDGEKLKENLSNQELMDIDNTIEDFYGYIDRYENENVIRDYVNKYDDRGIIKWVEGLTSTNDFVKDYKEQSYAKDESQLF